VGGTSIVVSDGDEFVAFIDAQYTRLANVSTQAPRRASTAAASTSLPVA